MNQQEFQEQQEREMRFSILPQLSESTEHTEEVEAVTVVPALSRSEVAKIRIALSRMAQEGPRQGRGAIATFWNLMAPANLTFLLYTLSQGELPLTALFALLLATTFRLNRLITALEQATTVNTLPEINPQWVGPLAEALEWPDARVRRIASLLLTRLLPTLTLEDAITLQPDQRVSLYSRLTNPTVKRDPALVIAILNALPTIGDSKAISFVERLATSVTWNGKTSRVREAARECMPLLEMHVEWLEEIEKEKEKERQREAEAREAEASVGAITAVAENTPPVTRESVMASARVDNALEQLEEERKKHQQPGMRLGYLLATWCMAVPGAGWLTFSSLMNHNWISGTLWGGLTLTATQMHRFTLMPKQTEAAKRLAAYDDVKGIGRLAEALDWPDEETREIVTQALTRLLPRVTLADAANITTAQRATLYRNLKMSVARTRPEFVKAILKALEQIGDDAAVPYVQKLADSQGLLSSGQRRVREAANECLPYLHNVALQNRYSQTLLRASSAVGSSPETLLRPASRNDETASEQLLRPGYIEE